MEFVAYPDVSNSDLMAAMFHESHVQGARSVIVSDSFDTSIPGKEMYDALRLFSEGGWKHKASVFLDSWMIVSENSSQGVSASFTVHGSSMWVNVSTNDYEQAVEFLGAISEHLPPVGDETDLEAIDVRFWMSTASGPNCQLRTLDTFHWDDVGRNYPKSVRGQLQDLMEMEPPKVGGKLILWHGHPGGGKTSAIKTLVDSWRDWADAEYIVDPEAFFGQATYMLSVLNRPTSRHLDEDKDRWRVIVVEDAGQFVHKDADATTGQAFSRLLNMTDGMIGQGMRVIVLITTNRPLEEMHEALRRPGRCIANIEFSKFTAHEASEWLGGVAVPNEMSLAELYESQKVTQIQTEKAEAKASTGQYI